MNNFVALDFETATGKRNSACAVGLVVVKNNFISERFWTLIQPPGNKYSSVNIRVHKITCEMTNNTGTFDQIYPILKKYIHNQNIVCHNAAFDLDVLSKTMSFYNIVDDLVYIPHCTMILYDGRSLDDCCNEFGIPLNHHDALSDAEACARLFLAHNGVIDVYTEPKKKLKKDNSPASFYAGLKDQKITGDLLKCKDPSLVDDNSPFKGKKVVISGTYDRWPDRKELALLIKDLGADIDTGVSKRTNFLIAGANVGPSKLAKMKANIAAGCNAKILNEKQVIELLNGFL
jgi:DNA polymerase-3 subunit epsilon